MRSRSARIALLLVVLCLVAYGLSTWHLDAESISLEESLSVYRAGLGPSQLPVDQASSPYALAKSAQPPLYSLLLVAFTRLAGDGDFSLRFLSVLWAALLVPLQYAVATRFWGRRAGAVAALLGALSPLYVRYGREAQLYALLAALGLLAVYAVDRALEEGRKRWLAAALLSTASALCTSWAALALLPALALRALLSGRLSRGRRLAPLAATAVVTLSGLAWLALALQRTGLSTTALLRLGDAWRTALAGAAIEPRAAWALALGSALLFILGASQARGRGRGALIAGYGIIPLGASLGAAGSAGNTLTLLAVPALYLGVAGGLERCSRRIWPLALAAGILLAGSMAISAYTVLPSPSLGADQDYRAVAQAIRSSERPRDVILAASTEAAAKLSHYYGGQLPTIVVHPSTDNERELSVARQATADLATRFDRIWLVRGSSVQDAVPAADWLQANAFLADSALYPGQEGGAHLDLYCTRSPKLQSLPPCQHSANIDYDDLRLEGYDLPLQPAAGGERAWVTLYWLVRQPTKATVSLRLVDDEGREWARSSGVSYPTFPPENWPAGTIVRDEASITIPQGVPSGWYQLELRMIDAGNGRPVEAESGAGPGLVPLGPLLVDPTAARQARLDGLMGVQAVPGGIRFGADVTLRAYQLDSASLVPGEWLHAGLYWQIDRKPVEDLALTLELLDGRGEVVDSRTVTPVTPECPPGAWQAGELLLGPQDLLVPVTAEPGVYRLRLSMHDALGRRLPIRDQWRIWTWGDDSIVLGQVRVVAAARDVALPEMEHTVSALSTAAIDLLGYDGVPTAIRHGDTLSVTLHWRAADEPDKSYKVSVQLLSSDGRLVLAQQDSVPATWTQPTTGWKAGDVVSDEHEVAIPESTPPQTATLIVALYDEDTGQRVQWLGDDQLQEYVALCSLEIVD